MGFSPPSRRLQLGRLFWVAALIIGVISIQHSSHSALANSPTTKPTPATITNTLNQMTGYWQVTNPKQPLIYAKAYTLIDGQTGATLLSSNSTDQVPIASTTKMMTALVAANELPLDRVVTVSPHAASTEGSGAGLVAGEQLTVKNLLYAMLIPSGNDAAWTLAEAYGATPGDATAFVAKMNEYATRYHLDDTHYQDPAGLDDTGHSSAANLAQIGRLLLQNPVLAEIVHTPQVTLTAQTGQVLTLKNTDRLILPNDSLYLPTAVGIKTGFTPDAGHCLVAAEQTKDGLLIGVILNTNEFTATASAQEMRKLFSWASTNTQHLSY